MSKLLAQLLRFLRLGVEGEEGAGDGPPPDLNALAEGDSTGDETLDDLIDSVEPTSGEKADPAEVSAAALKEARRRNQEAQTELENERRMRMDAERRAAPQQPGVDPQWQAEENEYAQAKAAGATEEQLRLLAWRNDSSRRIRQSQQSSNAALMEARDLQDLTEFGKLEITKPGIYKRYAPRVEKAIADMRRMGQNAPRLGVLKLLIGDDLIAGKVAPARKKAATAADGTVARGKAPDMRSDTSGKGGTSEREKRRARLENVRI